MKLTNLSLAIMVAVGVSACGGSGNDNSNKPADPPKPSTPEQPEQPKQPEAPDNQKTVDPTGTQVVDNKDLTKETTVGTLNYIRREASQYDRVNNPSKPASASPLLGVSLDDQNPKLTNIVLARQNITREDGTPVKAQFAGSDTPEPLDENGNVNYDSRDAANPYDKGRSLQEENFANVDTLASYKQIKSGAGVFNEEGKHFNADNVLRGERANRTELATDTTELKAVETAPGDKKGAAANPTPVAPGTQNTRTEGGVSAVLTAKDNIYLSGKTGTTAADAELKQDLAKGVDGGNTGEPGLNSLTNQFGATGVNAPVLSGDAKYSKVDKNGKAYYAYRYYRDYKKVTTSGGTPVTYIGDPTYKVVTAALVNALHDGAEALAGPPAVPAIEKNEATARRLGWGLVWWSSPVTSFENSFTRGDDATHKDFVNPNPTPGMPVGMTPADAAKFERDGGAATNGLIRAGGGLPTLGEELTYNKTDKKWEDHHKTTSRIFGRYHLATAVEKDGKKSVKPVDYNSFIGARTFTAEYKTSDGLEGSGTFKATQYSIGAVPNTLKYVQYGRVSNNLDLDAGKDGYPDGFIRNYFERKGENGSVDNYFYRGIHATTIEQMAALPSDQKAVYRGHALMYGIDNSFHGAKGGDKQNLPNAFAPTGANDNGLGLGNFVEARVDFGKKRVLGEVYNEWLLDPSKAELTRDKLVRFQGNINGNTVIGTADRTYIEGDDCATFKGSFFGEKAEEMGGSFNTVRDSQKYSSAYDTNDWGGVFGATKGDSNTFQGDDGNTLYGQ